jgi:hypothetical protein
MNLLLDAAMIPKGSASRISYLVVANVLPRFTFEGKYLRLY